LEYQKFARVTDFVEVQSGESCTDYGKQCLVGKIGCEIKNKEWMKINEMQI
jgi:hypothetical protein